MTCSASRSGSTVTWSQRVTQGEVPGLAAAGFEHPREERSAPPGSGRPQRREVLPHDLGPGPAEDALEGPVGLHDLSGAIEQHDAVADGIERRLPLTRRELSGVLGPAARRRARTVAISSSGSATLVR